MFRAKHDANNSATTKAMMAWMQKYVSPAKHGDMMAVAIGGGAVYYANKQAYLAKGMSEAEADAKAIADVEQATIRSQQSAEIYAVSGIQANTQLGRLLSTFQSAQVAYFNILVNLANSSNIPQKQRKKKITQAFTMLVAMPLVFGVLASAFVPRDDLMDYLYDIIFYNVGNSVIIGNILQGLVSTAWTGKRPTFDTLIPAEQVISSLYNFPIAVRDIMDDPENLEAWDKLAGSISPITGVPYKKIKNQYDGLRDYIEGNDRRFGRLLGISEKAMDTLEDTYNND
jgi:hypothetical protein